MMIKWFMGLILFGHVTASLAGLADNVVDLQLTNMIFRCSKQPYNKAIPEMHIGIDKEGNAKIGVALREIETFKTITAVVIVHKTESGFKIHQTLFPDIDKIRNPKDRKQVLSILRIFQNQPFDPLAEKSAVDALTGATKYGLKVSGYLNYMARKTALEMENVPDWPQQPITSSN